MTPLSDEQIAAVIAPLYALATGMNRVIADKPQVNRLAVLQAVLYAKRIRPSEIAEALGIRPSQVTRQVQNLEAEGLVAVASNPDDRRSWIVSLTDPGRSEIDRLNEIGMSKWRGFLTDWDPDEVDALARLLDKLRTTIADSKPSPPPRRRA